MLDDWVLAYGKKTQVVWTGNVKKLAVRGFPSEFFEDEILPIPITPEILEKNGFKRKEKGKSYTEYVSGDEHSIIALVFYKESIYNVDTVLDCELGFVGGLDRIHHCHIKYVHQLQHALKLCGINKNINL